MAIGRCWSRIRGQRDISITSHCARTPRRSAGSCLPGNRFRTRPFGTSSSTSASGAASGRCSSLVYGLESLRALLAGGDRYRDNRFEAAARAQEPATWLPAYSAPDEDPAGWDRIDRAAPGESGDPGVGYLRNP